MLFSLFMVTFPNKLLYFVCIRYLVVLQWLRPWATLLLDLIVLNLMVWVGRKVIYCNSIWFTFSVCILQRLPSVLFTKKKKKKKKSGLKQYNRIITRVTLRIHSLVVAQMTLICDLCHKLFEGTFVTSFNVYVTRDHSRPDDPTLGLCFRRPVVTFDHWLS